MIGLITCLALAAAAENVKATVPALLSAVRLSRGYMPEPPHLAQLIAAGRVAASGASGKTGASVNSVFSTMSEATCIFLQQVNLFASAHNALSRKPAAPKKVLSVIGDRLMKSSAALSDMFHLIMQRNRAQLLQLRSAAEAVRNFKALVKRQHAQLKNFQVNPNFSLLGQLLASNVEVATHFSTLWRTVVAVTSQLIAAEPVSGLSNLVESTSQGICYYMYRHMKTFIALNRSLAATGSSIVSKSSGLFFRNRWKYFRLSHISALVSFQASLQLALHRRAVIAAGGEDHTDACGDLLRPSHSAVTQFHVQCSRLEIADGKGGESVMSLIDQEEEKCLRHMRSVGMWIKRELAD